MTFDFGLLVLWFLRSTSKVEGKKLKRKRKGKDSHWCISLRSVPGQLLSTANALNSLHCQADSDCFFRDRVSVLWKEEGKGRNNSVFANCKNMTTQKISQLSL